MSGNLLTDLLGIVEQGLSGALKPFEAPRTEPSTVDSFFGAKPKDGELRFIGGNDDK